MTGQKLQDKRKQLELTIAELADRLGVTMAQIESWEAQQDVACPAFPMLLERAMAHLEDEISCERLSALAPFDHSTFDRQLAESRAQTEAANRFLEKSRQRTGIGLEETTVI